MKLIQKRGEKTNEFELVGDCLKIRKKKLLSTKEWEIHLEHVGQNKTIETFSKKGIHIIGVFFLSFAFLAWIGLIIEGNPNGEFDFLIWGSFFFILFAILCFKAPVDNKLILYGHHSKIDFFLDKPSREIVENFVNQLIQKSKLFIAEKYSRIDSSISEEVMLSRLNWLLENRYIENSKYKELKESYRTSRLM